MIRLIQRWRGLLRAVAVGAALGLGFWGWSLAKPPAQASLFSDTITNLFRTLQLITLQFPPAMDSPIPWQLSLARFLLPAVALLETWRLVLGSVRSQARLVLLGLRPGHVIIAPGPGGAASALLRQITARGVSAVAIMDGTNKDVVTQYENAAVAVIRGDPRLAETWESARVDAASMVFVAQSTDVENLNIAVSVSAALERYPASRHPSLVVALDSDILAEQVDLALDRAATPPSLRFQRLSIDEEATRPLFLAPPLPTLKADRLAPSRIVIVGLGPGARAMLRTALTLGQDSASSGPHITVLAPEADMMAEPILAAGFLPHFAATIELIPLQMAWGTIDDDVLMRALDGVDAPTLTAICLDDEIAIGAAIGVARFAAVQGWQDGSIAVHQSQEDRLLSMLARLDNLPGHKRLLPFGGILPDGTVARLMKEKPEKLPRAIHADYVRSLGDGAQAVTADWAALGETYRRASRAAAEHMSVKLASLGYTLKPGMPNNFQFSDGEIDSLARMEHRRWVAERLLRGWRLGPRNNERRRHPDLVPFDELPQSSQAKTRAAMRALPAVAGAANLAVVEG